MYRNMTYASAKDVLYIYLGLNYVVCDQHFITGFHFIGLLFSMMNHCDRPRKKN